MQCFKRQSTYTTQHITTGLDCNIECKGYYACRYLNVQAHNSGNVNLVGTGTDERSVYFATVNATTANGLTMTAYNPYSLYNTQIYCPEQSDKNCDIYCNDDYACYSGLTILIV